MLNHSSFNDKRSPTDRAMTLVEVVVALVLLASLVVGMVTAYAAHQKQGLRALEKVRAVEVADGLLTQWYQDGDASFPRDGAGIVPGADAFVWQTQTTVRNQIETMPVEIVRLQIFPQSARIDSARADDLPQPLAQVDLLLPPDTRWRRRRGLLP